METMMEKAPAFDVLSEDEVWRMWQQQEVGFDCLRRGLALWPSDRDIPLLPLTTRQASADEVQVLHWIFEDFPGCDLQIALGQSSGNVVAVQCKATTEMKDKFPETMTLALIWSEIISLRLYRLPPDMHVLSEAFKVDEVAVAVMGDGFEIPAPGSYGALGFACWTNQAQISPAPTWLIDALRQKPGPTPDKQA